MEINNYSQMTDEHLRNLIVGFNTPYIKLMNEHGKNVKEWATISNVKKNTLKELTNQVQIEEIKNETKIINESKDETI